MQCRQILVDWARMRDTRNNLKMTWSNGNSPKIWATSSQGSKEKKSAIKGKFAQDLDRNLIGEKDLTAGNKIMNRRIDSRSTTGNSHAPSHDNASKWKLLASTLNLPWLWAVASKFKSGVVLFEIWLRVK
jgi:hypothetical protein